jgi:hypothetical protein
MYMLHTKQELRKELIAIGILTTVLIAALAALYMYDVQTGVIGDWSHWLYTRIIG